MESISSFVWYYNRCPCTIVPSLKVQWLLYGILIRVRSDDNKLCLILLSGSMHYKMPVKSLISSSDLVVETSQGANFT